MFSAMSFCHAPINDWELDKTIRELAKSGHSQNEWIPLVGPTPSQVEFGEDELGHMETLFPLPFDGRLEGAIMGR